MIVAIYCAVAGYFFGAWASPGIDDGRDAVLAFVAAWVWPLTMLVVLTWMAAEKWQERAR